MGASETDNSPEFGYQPVRCVILKKTVWAIRTRQSDGSWRIVNCLDKDEDCFKLPCVFTIDAGEWPYPVSAKGEPVSR